MVDCSQFLEGYSEFRDGRFEDSVQARYEAHLSRCPSCSRYHRVMGRGVDVFRGLPQLVPSDDFLPRLQHRIYHLQDELDRSARQSSGISAGFTLVIAAVLAAAAWIPLVRPSDVIIEMSPVAANAPVQQVEPPTLFRSGPLLVNGSGGGIVPHIGSGPGTALFFHQQTLGSFGGPAGMRTVSLEQSRW